MRRGGGGGGATELGCRHRRREAGDCAATAWARMYSDEERVSVGEVADVATDGGPTDEYGPPPASDSSSARARRRRRTLSAHTTPPMRAPATPTATTPMPAAAPVDSDEPPSAAAATAEEHAPPAGVGGERNATQYLALGSASGSAAATCSAPGGANRLDSADTAPLTLMARSHDAGAASTANVVVNASDTRATSQSEDDSSGAPGGVPAGSPAQLTRTASACVSGAVSRQPVKPMRVPAGMTTDGRACVTLVLLTGSSQSRVLPRAARLAGGGTQKGGWGGRRSGRVNREHGRAAGHEAT